MGVMRNVFVRTNIKLCPDLQQLESGQGGIILLWAIDVVVKYNECQAKHSAVVKALK
ncbi:hypothetical protein F945_00869 [Acinetobacter rudis CIP 110305]|uniref:Uncharacterized protein n=2 Tax=Acinetobacter rudis TaxID=632955 RepID=S3NNL6_9GAMM|nr:hypothetical protein F945_00869 [Acinetobacter rudis CIP 110305]